MAKEGGWWTLSTTIEPDEIDLDHIAERIKEGYTQGEICATEENTEQKGKRK